MSDAILRIEHVTKRFGGLTAVSDFHTDIQAGELVGLIGPNGAGKTTLFNLITGVYEPTEGRITVNGKPIAGMTPDRITGLGMARTFQNIRLFDEMTVLENVKTAYNLRAGYGIVDAIFRTRRFKDEEKELHGKAMHLLQLFGLADDASERASSLAYGEQRRLEIARAMATAPNILLLDEPAAGMNAQETEELMEMLLDIKARFSLTLLLIEHDMKFVMRLCERIVVLDYGKIIAIGTPDQIKHDPKVIAAYLGDEVADEPPALPSPEHVPAPDPAPAEPEPADPPAAEDAP